MGRDEEDEDEEDEGGGGGGGLGAGAALPCVLPPDEGGGLGAGPWEAPGPALDPPWWGSLVLEGGLGADGGPGRGGARPGGGLPGAPRWGSLYRSTVSTFP